MKRFVDYFTLRNVVLYVIFSFLIGGLTYSLGGMIVFMYWNPSNDIIMGSFVLYLVLTFVCVFLFLLLIYGLVRLLLCHSEKGRKAVRIIYSLCISLLIICLLCGFILNVLPFIGAVICLILVGALCMVISLFIFKNIQNKTYRCGY